VTTVLKSCARWGVELAAVASKVLRACRERGDSLPTCWIDYVEFFHRALGARAGLLTAFEYYTLMRVLNAAFIDAREPERVAELLKAAGWRVELEYYDLGVEAVVRRWRPWFTDAPVEPPEELVVDLIEGGMPWAALDLYYAKRPDLEKVRQICEKASVDCGEFFNDVKKGKWHHISPQDAL